MNLQKIDTILEILQLSGEDKKITKSKLLTASLLHFGHIVKDKYNKEIDFDHVTDEYTTEADFEQKVINFQDKLKDLNIDFDNVFNTALKITLENFMRKLELNLPPERVRGLNKIISE